MPEIQGELEPSLPITMSGTATFNTFSYLLNGATSLLKTAKEDIRGSNYCRVSAVMFSAFAVEAHLNHIGEAKLPFWKIVEPKLPWRNKLELVAQHLGIILDDGKRPFQTLSDLFKFRDRLAHGKTTTHDVTYEYSENRGDDFCNLDPAWLNKFFSDEDVERVVVDVRQVIELFHKSAGFEEHTLGSIGSGVFVEQLRRGPEQ